MVTLQFIGSGDAFGSGGRFQTCILLRGAGSPVLIDCGASSLIAMKRLGVEPLDVSAIVLTHLHGDHYAGIPFLILDGQFRHRATPLTIAGPPGSRERINAAMEVMFPGASQVARRFAVDFVDLVEGEAVAAGPAKVTGFQVAHASGAPAFAVRLEYEGKIVAYSGDTQWTDALLQAANGADLFVAEAYFFDKPIKFHLDFRTLEFHRPQLGCRRLVLTHMSEEMLRRRADVPVPCADDGTIIPL
ncbi:MAG: MBL fold metallo-hydrolase [Deltaproteobacteria bacterium]|nr:MBL fold metallo-hydrolase [Deltaproteobacteria bacterium]